jgi:murein DD-endopeptidase MepM/ murein hydrolase activator NlpD
MTLKPLTDSRHKPQAYIRLLKSARFLGGLLLGLLTLLALTGCQQEILASVVAVETAVPAIIITSTPAPQATNAALPPPALVVSSPAAAPTDMPSFAAVAPTALEAAQAEMVVEETMGEETAVTDSDTPATETSDATAIPTFTPPALPFTSADEHYWLQRPIPEGGTVWTDKTYPYGSTRGGTLRPHHGVEFYVEKGTQIIAAASGAVVTAGNDSLIAYGPHTNFYGNLVVIQLDATYEGQPVYILHGHLSDIYVTEGQRVDVGQLIALSGASGIADGPHLHFEVRLGQNSYESTRNPRLWLYPFPDYGTVAGRIVRANGSLVEEAPITLDRIDGASRFLASTSYAGTTVNADDRWQENFVIDDVPMGYYEVRVAVGQKKFTQEIYVFPYLTNFVEIVIED